MKRFISISFIIILTILKINAQCSISGELSVCVGSTTQLTGSGAPALSNPWISSAPSIATIDNNGLVTGVTAGISIITYTDNTGCSITATLTVTNPVTPTFTQLGPYCVDASPGILPTTSNNSITGTWSPSAISTASAGSTVYTFTPNAGECATTTTMTVVVNSNVTPTFTQLGPYCVGASPGILSTTSNNSITGTWSPSAISTVSAGSIVYTFTPNAGECATSTTMTVVVNSNVTPTFTQLGPYCVGASPGILPTTSNNSITGTWSPSAISTASAGSTVYTFTPNAGECATTTTMTVVVNSNITPAFTQLGPYCVGASPGTLPATSSNSITGTWSPSTISTESVGSTVYTFTPDAGQCATTTTLTVVVNSIVTPTFTQLGPYCAGASPGILPTTSNNSITGTWSPSAISTASAGSTVYTFTPNAGQCGTTTTMTVVVNSNVTPTFTQLGPYCVGASPGILPTTSNNSITGTWSPSAISTASAGLTVYTFTPDAGQCATTATMTVVVNSNVTPVFTQLGPYCVGASPGILPTTSNNSITGTWSPSAISTVSAGSTVYTFTPNAGQCATTTTMTVVVNSNVTPVFTQLGSYCVGASPGILPTTSNNSITGTWSPSAISTVSAGSIVYTFTPNAGECATTTTMTVVVNSNVTPTFTQLGPYCVGASPGILPTTSNNSITGTWSPSAISTASAGSTVYTFTPNAGQCGTTTTMTVVVNSNVTPTFTQLGPYCVGASPGILPTTSNNSITGTWSPSAISTASAGSTVYTFTPNAGQCATTTTMTVVVNSNVTPAFTQLGPYCVGASPGILPTTSNNSITGTWSPSAISTASAGSTVYTFTPNAGQCAISTTMSIIINPNITPSFSAVGPYCSGAAIPALPTTSINGITGIWTPAINNISTTTYTFTPLAGLCATTTSLTITINPIPAAPSIGTITQPNCSVATGSVALGSLPASGTWTLTRYPGAIISTGTGTTTTISGLAANTYTFTVTNASGCISAASANLVINAQPPTPTAPAVGTITQPTCTVATGSVALGGLPASGTWTLTRNPGAITSTGTGTTTTISGLTANTYTFTVTNASGCTSSASANVVINAQPPTPAIPAVGTITQPTCTLATGSVALGGLPASGSWTITITPGATTVTGTGTNTTISGLTANNYTFRVTNSFGCTSTSSTNVIINAQPPTPAAPTTGTITQPTCTVATGSVALAGLPSSGTWTITRTPGGATTTGTGTTTTISGLAANTYTFTVTNAVGCTSPASASVVINTQPPTPVAPVVGTITQPTCTVATGSVALAGLPSSGTWTITSAPGGATATGTGTTTTISGLAANTYTFTVTSAAGCTSPASANAVINTQPPTPAAPATGTITQPTCTMATGGVALGGLPASGTWTITGTPGGTSTTGTGTTTSISGLAANTYTFTVTNAFGCTSPASANVVINTQPPTPMAPVIGTITQPTCTLATGSVALGGLPASGTWTITGTPGGTTATGTGATITISGLAANTYTFIVTNSVGCTSPASANVVINTQPPTPTAPVIGTITQPTCTVATGIVELGGLPSSGTWTITRTPGGATTTGTGTTNTLSGLTANTYTFTVTNSAGCTSSASASVVINAQPPTPTAPITGTITQPTCTVATGSVALSGLPAGNWTINPGLITGSGPGNIVSGLVPGTYNFTVTNAAGCTSASSANVVINAQPPTPNAPVIGTITQPPLNELTGNVVLNGLPSTGTWILTRTPGGTTTGTGTSTSISGLAAGTYTFRVTNASGCTSPASANVVLYTFKLYDPDNNILTSNDTIKIDHSDAGAISIKVESDADWKVSDNSLWFQAVKENSSSAIKVTYMENISAVDKVASIKITYALNGEIGINLKQKARVSQLNESKFENVKVYPNPVGDYVYLNFGKEEFEKITISIANIQGYLISVKDFYNISPDQIVELNVSGLSVGQYFISVGDGTGHKTFQMIKY